jgi:hypothetical protein
VQVVKFDYTIMSKKGCENEVTDTLSRNVQNKNGESECNVVIEVIPIWIEEIKDNYEGDQWVQQVMNEDESVQQEKQATRYLGIIMVKNRLYVGIAGDWRCKVITWMHDSNVGVIH